MALGGPNRGLASDVPGRCGGTRQPGVGTSPPCRRPDLRLPDCRLGGGTILLFTPRAAYLWGNLSRVGYTQHKPTRLRPGRPHHL